MIFCNKCSLPKNIADNKVLSKSSVCFPDKWIILFSGLWYCSRENSGIETKCLFNSKSVKATVPADFVTSVLKMRSIKIKI